MARLRNIAGIELGRGPVAAVAIDDTTDAAAVKEALAGRAAVVELRVDLFASRELAHAAEMAARYDGHPRLITIRHADEGGGWNAPESERLDLYRGLYPYAEAVDCELGSEICATLAEEARAKGILSIGSFHNFDCCPEDAVLQSLAQRADDAGVDVLKVAANCQYPSDVRRLAAFCMDQAERGVIVIGMGAHGTATRILFPALGSLITYTFLGEPTAPGQLNFADTIQYLNALYPADSSGGG